MIDNSYLYFLNILKLIIEFLFSFIIEEYRGIQIQNIEFSLD